MSRPLQILLVAALLFGAVYMLALRPKGDGGGSSTAAKPAHKTSTSPAQGPGSSIPGGLGRAVTKARGAAGQSDAANQRIQQATGDAKSLSPTAPAASASTATAAHGKATSAAPRPAPTPKATSTPGQVRAAMASGKVVVLLFWNGQASDDRRVHEEFAHVSSHGGRALIVAAPVRQVSLFSSSLRGIQVLQSPTIVVVDRRHKARTLVGYTDRAEIGQAVDDAVVGR